MYVTLGEAVALNIAVVVFASPHISSFRFDHICHHIVDQSVLIPNLLGLELCLVAFFVDALEGVLEPAVINLENRVLGCEIQGVFSGKCELETAVSKLFDAFISVVHCETDSALSLEFVDFHSLLASVFTLENNLEGSWFIDSEVSGFVLISECMSSDDDRFFPSGDESGDVLDDDGFSEDGAIEDVSDGAVGAFPHLLQLELLDSGFIGGDGGALDAYLALLDCLSGLYCHFVVGGIAVLDAQIEIEDVEIEEGKNEVVLDGFPDDAGHLVAVELGHWLSYLDFGEFHKICCDYNCGNYKLGLVFLAKKTQQK